MSTKKTVKIFLVIIAGLITLSVISYRFLNPLLGELFSELDKKSLFYSQLINDVNGDEISDINDIKFVDYNFSNVINVHPEVGGDKITVFFRSNISDFMGSSMNSISGPYFAAEYKDGVPHESNQFVNKCVKGLIKADHFIECRYIVYIVDIVDVYSDDKAYYYYIQGDVSNKLMIRRAFVEIYDVSSGDRIASNIFDGSTRTRNAIRFESIYTPNVNIINEFLTGIIGQ